MTCRKCSGLMLGVECTGDWLDRCLMYGCVQCGNYEDAQILANRASHVEPREVNHANHQPVRVGG